MQVVNIQYEETFWQNNLHDYSGMLRTPGRSEMIRHYAWAVPNPHAIKTIAALSPIVEIGAGSGYWAYLLTEAGADVVAYDMVVRGDRDWSFAKLWFPVVRGGIEMAAKHGDRTLMLCWPPYDTPMAANALCCYPGNTVVYIGEGSGGCTGSHAFHHQIEMWECIHDIDIPQYCAIHDRLFIYRRPGSEQNSETRKHEEPEGSAGEEVEVGGADSEQEAPETPEEKGAVSERGEENQ